ncbi:MAG: tryptophan synthase subunit alpha [Propionibacteriaceae bacterium]|nr:tryptophan synthase subunit alpha [Propionibacteriaceae bacterium]
MKLICYLSNGYPTLGGSAGIARCYAEAGCDLIEIDLPARNPYLEGEFIAGRMARALADCEDYDAYMANMVRIARESPAMKVLVLSYEQTVLEIGVEKFLEFCVANDFRDVILVGLTSDEVKNRLIAGGVRVSCYVQFQLDPAEIESAKQSNGFVYLQAKAGPEQVNPAFPTLADCVAELRRQGIERPIYCGVGVATPEDFAMVERAGADGAFVGSTILKLAEQPDELRRTIRAFKGVGV